MDVAVVTCAEHPDLDPYDRPLLAALAAEGLDARAVVWNGPGVAWEVPRAVVVRSAWDSHLHHEAFNRWADGVERVTRLYNPAQVLRWNTHKRYLRDLEARGVPVTPTTWVERGQTLELAALLRKHGWDAVVLKPAVSAGARETYVFARSEVELAQRELDRLASEGEVLVQPYLRAFETERSYVFIDGVLSHAVRRPPTLQSAPRSFLRPSAFTPENAEELRLARAVLEAAGPLLYARVDLATDNEGRPRLQELEATEPCLFLSLDAGAPARLARAIAAKL